MHDTLKRCLADLEERIDPQEEDAILQAWRDFSENRFHGDIFLPHRSRPNPPQVEWPHVSVNTALGDFDAMALQQFGGVSKTLADGGGAVLNVRCNYGSSIAPLLFGVEVFVMDEELETLPTSRPLNDKAAIRRLIDVGRARSEHRLRRTGAWRWDIVSRRSPAVPQDRQVRLHLPPRHAGADGHLRGGLGQHDLLRRAG